MKLKVAVNASPLIFLAKAGLLHILRELFQEVHTTKGVLDEIAEPMKLGREAPEYELVKNAAWIKITDLPPKERQRAERMSEELGIDIGECEVAMLYQRKNFDLLIAADIEAERGLRSIGINVRDLSDILYFAAQQGVVNLKDAARKVWDVGYRTERIMEILES